MNESEIGKKIQLLATKLGLRLFRNNTALAWVGKAFHAKHIQTITVNPGDVVIRSARPLHAGLCVGGSDYIGWYPLTISHDMVGLTVAIFSGVEIKSPGKRATKEQQNFIDVIKSSGGLGIVVSSESEFAGGIDEFRTRPRFRGSIKGVVKP